MNSNTVLFIGFVWPEPTSSAAGTRIIQLIALFRSFGFDIVFASAAQRSEHSAILSTWEVVEREIELNSDSFNVFVNELNPDYVVFDRFMTEEQYGWRVTAHSDAVRILDSEDLHCLRKARQTAARSNAVFDITSVGSQDIAKREIASIYRCDLTLVISDFEYSLLLEDFKIDNALLFYLPLFAAYRAEGIPVYDAREGFVFIGNFLHEPNRDAVVYLKNVIWPLIRAHVRADLHIYGAYTPQQIADFNNPGEGFRVHGRAASATNAIASHRVMLAPLRFGAGIKGKLLEAMQCGTPSVATAIGAEGISGDLPWSGNIADDPKDFAAAATHLYRDSAKWHLSQQNGFTILEERFSQDLFAEKFQQSIMALRLNLQKHRQANFIGAMLQHHTMRSTEFMSRWIEAKK